MRLLLSLSILLLFADAAAVAIVSDAVAAFHIADVAANSVAVVHIAAVVDVC